MLFGRFKVDWKYFEPPAVCVLCREVVLISECPLSEVSLYMLVACVSMYACMHVCMYVHIMYVCIYTCLYVRMYIRMYVCMYVHNVHPWDQRNGSV